jgi:hypothetical protein
MTCRDFLEIFSPDSLFTGGVGELAASTSHNGRSGDAGA